MTAPQGRSTDLRWPLHDHEAGALQVAHNALSSDCGHILVGMMNALATFEPQREGDRGGEVFQLSGPQFIVGDGIAGLASR